MESALSDGLRRTATNQAREKAVEDAAATADILAKVCVDVVLGILLLASRVVCSCCVWRGAAWGRASARKDRCRGSASRALSA
jgi:hypothetical protein